MEAGDKWAGRDPNTSFKGTPQWPNSLTLSLTFRRFHHYQTALYSYTFNIWTFGDPIYNTRVSKRYAIKLKTMDGGVRVGLNSASSSYQHWASALYAVKWDNSRLCFRLSWEFTESLLGKCLLLWHLSICLINKGNCTLHTLIHVMVGLAPDRKHCEGS